MSLKDEIYYNELFTEYGKLLTDKQKEIFDMYFCCDLSLSEIAEIQKTTRQSVSDALTKAKKQLQTFEDNLGFVEKKKSILSLLDEGQTKEKIRKILGDN